jgi:hypothetical protein
MLTLRRTRIVDIVPHDYEVLADGFTVGRIHRPVRGHPDSPPWGWSLFCIPQTGADGGDAADLESAKQAFRLRWEQGRFQPVCNGKAVSAK